MAMIPWGGIQMMNLFSKVNTTTFAFWVFPWALTGRFRSKRRELKELEEMKLRHPWYFPMETFALWKVASNVITFMQFFEKRTRRVPGLISHGGSLLSTVTMMVVALKALETKHFCNFYVLLWFRCRAQNWCPSWPSCERQKTTLCPAQLKKVETTDQLVSRNLEAFWGFFCIRKNQQFNSWLQWFCPSQVWSVEHIKDSELFAQLLSLRSALNPLWIRIARWTHEGSRDLVRW